MTGGDSFGAIVGLSLHFGRLSPHAATKAQRLAYMGITHATAAESLA
jgi:hypothetical protein